MANPRFLYVAMLGFMLWLLAAGALGCSPAAAPTSTAVPSPIASALPRPSPAPTSTASSAPATILPTAAAEPVLSGDPARGKALFASLPCSSCHDVTHPFPGGLICPNLGNIATEAARIVQSPDYHGQAHDPAGYIRESIVNPNAYVVPGAPYRNSDGTSVMPKDFGSTLKPEQVDDLVAFLMTLK